MNNEVNTRFKALCEIFQRSPSVSNQQCKPSPNGSPFDGDELLSLIKQNVDKMPENYRPYGKLLKKKIRTVTNNLEGAYYRSVWEGESDVWARGYARLQADTAVGAVVDWAQPELKPHLQYFAAVAADLFRSADRKKERARSLNTDVKIRTADLPP